jgi:hypothetical protein
VEQPRFDRAPKPITEATHGGGDRVEHDEHTTVLAALPVRNTSASSSSAETTTSAPL